MLPPLEPWLLKNAKELAVDRDLFDDERIIRLPKATLQVTSSKVDGDELWVVVADSARSVLARIAAARLARLHNGRNTQLIGAIISEPAFKYKIDALYPASAPAAGIHLPPRGFYLELDDFQVYGEAGSSLVRAVRPNLNDDHVIKNCADLILAEPTADAALREASIPFSPSQVALLGGLPMDAGSIAADKISLERGELTPRAPTETQMAEAGSQSDSAETQRPIKSSPASSYADIDPDPLYDDAVQSYQRRAASEAEEIDGMASEDLMIIDDLEAALAKRFIPVVPAPPRPIGIDDVFGAPPARPAPASSPPWPSSAQHTPAPTGRTDLARPSTIRRAPRDSLDRAVRLLGRPGEDREAALTRLLAFDELPFARYTDVPLTDIEAHFADSPPLRRSASTVDRAVSPAPAQPLISSSASRRIRLLYSDDDEDDQMDVDRRPHPAVAVPLSEAPNTTQDALPGHENGITKNFVPAKKAPTAPRTIIAPSSKMAQVPIALGSELQPPPLASTSRLPPAPIASTSHQAPPAASTLKALIAPLASTSKHSTAPVAATSRVFRSLHGDSDDDEDGFSSDEIFAGGGKRVRPSHGDTSTKSRKKPTPSMGTARKSVATKPSWHIAPPSSNGMKPSSQPVAAAVVDLVSPETSDDDLPYEQGDSDLDLDALPRRALRPPLFPAEIVRRYKLPALPYPPGTSTARKELKRAIKEKARRERRIKLGLVPREVNWLAK